MTPDTYTLSETMLAVDDGHELYLHDWGNPDAKTPIIYLHGGPGGSVGDRNKMLFNPQVQRVIFHDQRGCGKSLPYGSLEHNTTDDLVADIAKILDHFKIERCIINGGSWGSALAFCFAIAHPERVAAMVLFGIWTFTKEENSWLDQGGFKTFFPDAWEAYEQSVPETERANPSAYHFARILGNDETARKTSALAYETLEGAAIKLDDRQVPGSLVDYDENGIRTEVHYLANACFKPEGYVARHASKLTMPIHMVQGRYDMVCPPITAYRLSKLLPKASLHFTTSGHVTEHESWSLLKLLLAQESRAA